MKIAARVAEDIYHGLLSGWNAIKSIVASRPALVVAGVFYSLVIYWSVSTTDIFFLKSVVISFSMGAIVFIVSDLLDGRGV